MALTSFTAGLITRVIRYSRRPAALEPARLASKAKEGDRSRQKMRSEPLQGTAADLSVVTDVIGKQTNPSDALGQPSLLDPSF